MSRCTSLRRMPAHRCIGTAKECSGCGFGGRLPVGENATSPGSEVGIPHQIADIAMMDATNEVKIFP